MLNARSHGAFLSHVRSLPTLTIKSFGVGAFLGQQGTTWFISNTILIKSDLYFNIEL